MVEVTGGQPRPIAICVVGAAGAFGRNHLAALAEVPEARVSLLAGAPGDPLAELAAVHAVPEFTTDLSAALVRPDIDAVILATPTPLHARQALQCLAAGKHVLVEIPMADCLADAEALVAAQQRSALVAMAGHTRRFNPSHQWLHQRIVAGDLTLQHLEVQTRFFRRTNTNALGEPRSWTDHLLWHHACHTVDLFQWQTGSPVERCFALQGPPHPELGIAMDMNVGLQAQSGALCSLALTFNNDGPLGTSFRYICNQGTYVARYDDLVDGYDRPIDLRGVAESPRGLVLQDREFVTAIQQQREPEASVARCLPAMATLHRLEQSLMSSKRSS